MSWRDQYQLGSFRGASFKTVQHQTSGGRRAALYEYPGRDEPSVEDLGRRAREYVLELFVVGGAYFADRNALLDALDAEGPGRLVHPYLGEMQVICTDYSLTENTDEGGIARFQVTFNESGQSINGVQGADANALAIDAADAAVDGAALSFADRFSIKDLPSFVEESAAAVLGDLGALTSTIAAGSAGAGSLLSTFAQSLNFLDDLTALVRTPLSLGSALVALVRSTLNVASSSDFSRTTAAVASLVDFTVEAPLYQTEARQQQQANAEAILHLVRHVALAELVRTVAETEFSSRDAALALRDDATETLDNLALVAADAGEDQRAADYDILRRALVADVAERIPGLPRLQDYTPKATEPAIVIANRLYGAGRAQAMAENMTAGLSINPAFVPGGIPIKVLTNA